MYKGFYMKGPNLAAIITALCCLLIYGAQAENYKPAPGGFRPTARGGSSNNNQSGFRQNNSRLLQTPVQQQPGTTSQPYPYAGSASHYLPVPQPAPVYQTQNTPDYVWNRSFNYNPGNIVNEIFRFGGNDPTEWAQLEYRQPSHQPPLLQMPVYPQQHYYGSSYPQQYNYGSSYPQQYNYGSDHLQQYGQTAPQTQQPPATVPRTVPSQPIQRTAPFTGRPYGGGDNRFRPPELKSTN